uniref:Olfactory receptor family 6 subfamily M member 1 n=1 Tax=Nomascus leucogenys TaxID=61853 RepID=A0A2I3HFZ2_NOMLE
MGNWSTVTEFTLIAFPALLEIRISLFMVLVLTYTLTATGNIIIISLIWNDHRLQTPMYFFLSNLSFLDILYTTVITPKLLACLLGEKKTISFAGCMIQTYFYFFLGTVEFILLAVIRACLLLVLGCWVGAFLLTRLPYCGKEIDHFFCDIAPLLQVACINTHFIEKINFLLSTLVILSSLAFTTGSYVYIISTILRIPSTQGRQKAFSTCASHITVVSIAYGSNIFVYVRPNQNSSLDYDKVATVLIIVVIPLLNPFIYSLRNEKVQEVLRETVNRIMT